MKTHGHKGPPNSWVDKFESFLGSPLIRVELD
jgi:hypothetical protein